MANNIYENQFCFVDSSIIISNYFLIYYIIARYNIFSMSDTKTNTHTSTVFYFMSLRKLVLFFQIRIEILHTANDTAITSAMWNTAYASTNKIILCKSVYICQHSVIKIIVA